MQKKEKQGMKIQYASDLHLEFADNMSFIEHGGIEPVGDVLVLAGDVSFLADRKMWKRPGRRFSPRLMIHALC